MKISDKSRYMIWTPILTWRILDQYKWDIYSKDLYFLIFELSFKLWYWLLFVTGRLTQLLLNFVILTPE